MNTVLFKTGLIIVTLTVATIALVTAAKADILTTSSNTRVLQQALAAQDDLKIYDSKPGKGFNFAGGLFSGRASGVDPIATDYSSNGFDNTDHTAELEGDVRVHALLLDGKYEFADDLGSGLPLHPYVTSGVGLAMYDYSSSPTAANLTQSGNTVPLFRVGCGLAYQLGEQWNMSLDYKAGFSGGGNQVLSGQQSTDMQSVNMGMHFSF